ncbi:MAG: FAD-binding oxidoreductase [Candidatus Dormibacteria bacterium]
MTATRTESTVLRAALVELLGADAIREGDAALPYQYDEARLQRLVGHADAVVAPRDAGDVAKLVAWCCAEGVPLVPRGGGTGLAGGAVPIDGGVVCSVERLNRVLTFEPELWRLHVDAGVTTAKVQGLARDNGLFYPPDPGAAEQSQIGGNIACNAAGPHCFKYGVTGAWVTGLTVVIGGGETLELGGPLRKDVAGYDLKSLFIGSEGTLGIITSAWLRLIPAPEARRTVVAGFPDVHSGVAAVLRTLASGTHPATLEYLDPGSVAAARPAFPGDLPEPIRFLVLTEVDGAEAAMPGMEADIREALGPGALTVATYTSRREQADLARWRGGLLYAVSAQRGGKMSEDIAVPVDRLEEAIEMTLQAARAVGLPGCSFGHAGDGNLHSTFMIDPTDPVQVAAAERGMEMVFAGALALGGTVSGEHGLGWLKRGQFARQFRGADAQLQSQLKGLFDPRNLLNPGKKVSPVQAGEITSTSLPSGSST